MSEVSDYKLKVKTMTIEELVKENESWAKQRSEATGEYGYWGGVTGSEIVEAELKRRTGTLCTILKSFVDVYGIFRMKGTNILSGQISETMYPELVKRKFIKEENE